MNLGKVIEHSTIAKILQRMVRNEEGILRVSPEFIKRLTEDKTQIDYNFNHLCPSNRVLRFTRNVPKEIVIAEEFVYDLEKNVYVQTANKSLSELLKSGEINNVVFVPELDAHLANVELESCVLMAGSFNPIHHGHTQLLSAAVETAGSNLMGVFELSISNAAKSEIGDRELYSRMTQFIAENENKMLLVTNKPYFRDKVNFIDSNSWFCIGADTYKRFFDLKFYESPKQLLEFTNFLISRGVKLVVGPRADRQKLDTVDDYLDLVPTNYRSSVREVENFRVDISSTEIRNSRTAI